MIHHSRTFSNSKNSIFSTRNHNLTWSFETKFNTHLTFDISHQLTTNSQYDSKNKKRRKITHLYRGYPIFETLYQEQLQLEILIPVLDLALTPDL
ncbi:unnamed protein product [Ambrosiozyma monospora]|uniref:Unnamed protein product n=1 Tax=Ambrosiozyma monospora TaxID=43982 RepID=A0A9W6T4J2_AMBMO|nr:unnamed protein product [Ambrosiozyma monospora]